MDLLIASVALALGISAACSLMEATLLSLTPNQVADLSGKHPKMGALWSRFKSRIDEPIAAILILNTAAHTIGASVAGASFNKLYGEERIWVFSLIFTGLMLQFTEILPKNLGVRLNRRLAIWIGRPLQLATVLLRPAIWLVHVINRPFEGGDVRGEKRQGRTLEEIATLAGLARLSREISPQQERIILGASRLSRQTARDIMIPADQVSFLSTESDLDMALRAGLTDLHTRYPVIEGQDRDRVAGYVNLKELVKLADESESPTELRWILRPVYFVTPDTGANELLRAFVERRTHFAMVRDEDERVLGLVTQEDVIEELVGELEDEFDHLPHHKYPLGVHAWSVGGGIPVRDLAAELGVDEWHVDGTLAAWVDGRSEDPPRPKSVYTAGEYNVEVRRVRRGRVYEAVIYHRRRGTPRNPEGG